MPLDQKIHAVQVKMHLTFQGLRKEYLCLKVADDAANAGVGICVQTFVAYTLVR